MRWLSMFAVIVVVGGLLSTAVSQMQAGKLMFVLPLAVYLCIELCFKYLEVSQRGLTIWYGIRWGGSTGMVQRLHMPWHEVRTLRKPHVSARHRRLVVEVVAHNKQRIRVNDFVEPPLIEGFMRYAPADLQWGLERILAYHDQEQ